MGSSDDVQLRKLADDVRNLLNEPIEIAEGRNAPKDGRWQGPNADHVRGELATRKTRLGTMAGELDKEAAGRKENDKGPKPN